MPITPPPWEGAGEVGTRIQEKMNDGEKLLVDELQQAIFIQHYLCRKSLKTGLNISPLWLGNFARNKSGT